MMQNSLQDEWIKIAESIREELEKTVPFMPTMKPDEKKNFIEAVQAALWFEHHCHLWDKNMDAALAILPFGD